MKMELRNYQKFSLIAAMLLLGLCSTVVCEPSTSSNDANSMQNDDYDYYADDQSAPSQSPQKTPLMNTTTTNDESSVIRPRVHFDQANVTVTGMKGKELTLTCDAKEMKDHDVILWYKDGGLVSTGKNVFLPSYSLNPTNFALTILDTSDDHQGLYVCEVLPHKVRKQINVIVAEHPLEVLVPESSKSGAGTLSSVSVIFAVGLCGLYAILET